MNLSFGVRKLFVKKNLVKVFSHLRNAIWNMGVWVWEHPSHNTFKKTLCSYSLSARLPYFLMIFYFLVFISKWMNDIN
jgi:hypothetical protein